STPGLNYNGERRIRRGGHKFMIRFGRWMAAAMLAMPVMGHAQLFKLTKEQLIELTAQNPFERFPDGRPKVPDSIIERAKGMSSEEVWVILSRNNGFRNQYEDGFQTVHPGKKMVGRAFTVQFMPARADLDAVVNAKGRVYNQTALDMLGPGDVLVVDLFGKVNDGTIVGDNLYYYMAKTAKCAGLVVDGAIRDLDGISEIDMQGHLRKAHPTALTNVNITGINVPVRISN